MCKRGDIYWIDFDKYFLKAKEGNDSRQMGIRPAVLIQNDIGNRYSPTVIVAAITTQLKKVGQPTHVLIKGINCGLPRDSMILTEQFATVPKSALTSQQYIGKLSDKELNELNKAVAISIGIADNNEENNNSKIESPIDLPYIRDNLDTIQELSKEYKIYGHESAKRIMDSCLVKLNRYCKENNIDINLLKKQLRGVKNIELVKASC